MRKQRLTPEQKRRGELACRFLSAKAWRVYADTDPLAVYEIETEEGNRYAVRGCFGSEDGLTFEGLQNLLEDLAEFVEEVPFV